MYTLRGWALQNCYLDSIELMRNTEFLVLELMVIENGVLSISEECGYWRVCNMIEQWVQNYTEDL